MPTCPEGPAGSLGHRAAWSPSPLSALRRQGWERFPTAGVPGATHSSQGWNVNSSLSRQGPQAAAFHLGLQKPGAQGKRGTWSLANTRRMAGAGQCLELPCSHIHCSPTPGISSIWVRAAARHPVSYGQTLSFLIWSPKGWPWSQRVTRYTPLPFASLFASCASPWSFSASQRQSLEPPLLQKEHASSSQKTVTSSAPGTVSTPGVVPTGQPGGKAAMALSRGSGRVEKLSPELLGLMTLLSALVSLDHSPDVSHLGPGQRWISCCPTQHLARVQPPASCLMWYRRGPCPACCASPGTDRGKGLEVVGTITARANVIWSLRSCVGQFQPRSTSCFFPLQETTPPPPWRCSGPMEVQTWGQPGFH